MHNEISSDRQHVVLEIAADAYVYVWIFSHVWILAALER